MRRHKPGLRFEVTDTHLELLRKAYVDWCEEEFGAPCIDPKRPFGNSDVIDDMLDVTGGSASVGGGEYDDVVLEDLHQLYAELETVLQIVLRVGEFRPGAYTRPTVYTTDWHLEGL